MNRIVFVSATALAAAVSPAFAQLVVDNMNEGEFAVDGSSMVVAGSTDNIIGGSRFVGTTGAGSTFTRAAGNDFATFNNQSGGNSVLTLDYGEFDGGNGALDTDFGTDNRFIAIDIPRAVGPGQIALDLTSSAGTGISQTQTITGAGTYYFDFEDMGFGDVDFADIDRATFRVLSANGGDFDIGPIRALAAPAPGAAALLALGALAGVRRRR